MEIAIGILALLAAGLAAACGWLALGRTRLATELAALEARSQAQTDTLTRDCEDLRQLVAQREREIRDTGEMASKSMMEATRLAQELEGVHRLNAQEIQALKAAAAKQLEANQALITERLQAVQRERDEIKTALSKVEQTFRDAFGNLAADALKSNREQFLALAEQKLTAKTSQVDQLVRPIAETLAKTDAKLAVIEAAGTELKFETSRLVRALREPTVRGRYGEMQLRRVAELAGMAAYCDFCEQSQTRDGDGVALRPDMVVKLPNNRTVVVDAKTNIKGYIDALSAKTPEESERMLEHFAKAVAEQAVALGRKKYWTQYQGSPEFVVMFIPGDQFIDAALSRQPTLLERAAEQGVILASPSTLIGLLRAVAIGYQEQKLARAAEELRELGKELHERAATAMEHVVKLGQALSQTVEKYNDFVGSYERRLEPVLRKFEDEGVKSGKELPELPVVEARVRTLAGQLSLLD